MRPDGRKQPCPNRAPRSSPPSRCPSPRTATSTTPACQPLYRSLDAAGVDGVFIAGTTGEFTALDDAERDTVLTEALAVFGPERVYHHVGAASARQAERLTARAVALGARNLAAITPYYLPAGPRSLVDYYRRLDAVADEARIFVYLYAGAQYDDRHPRAARRARRDPLGRRREDQR